ncbi:Tocopherol O-methyltransferase [Forsythia ovata]|uniref:Tocopherol O-methyltransferase n=1 Tax=Forsythia ovata TaxID=205694 RepID=A0ABD1SPX8_9LAMI
MVGSCIGVSSTCSFGTTLQWGPGLHTFISRGHIIDRNASVQVLNRTDNNSRKDIGIGIGIGIGKRVYFTAVSGGGRKMQTVVNAAAVETLQKGIAEFYDESSGIWENIWGDHMHHGFYEPDSSVSLSDHRSAQIRMIEEALRFASISDDPMQKPRQIVDVGCGIGGSSRYLARKYEARCQGITLSPVQAQRAQALAASQGLDDKVSFQVADALNQPFEDGQFNLVWSMESGEHMPDKTKFVNELARVAAPGGTIIIVTWCHRDLSPSEESLSPEEKELLNKICDAFFLPAWCSTADYVKLLESLSLQDIKAADWSENVAPFWPAVIKSALTWKGITSLLRSGWKTIKGALAMPLMIEGYNKGLIKFAIITCRKPVS